MREAYSQKPRQPKSRPRKTEKRKTRKPKMRKRKKIAQTKTEIYISFTLGLRFFRQSCVIVVS